MKYGSWIGLIGLLLMLSAGAAHAQTGVTVTLPSIALEVGETGILNATIDCPENCSQFATVLSFNPEFLRVEGAVVGPYLGPGVILDENAVDNRTGHVRLSASVLGAPPADADTVLFTLNVTGLASGTTTIHFDSLTVQDLSGTSFAVTSVDSTLTVGGEVAALTAFTDHPDWDLAFTSERDGNPEIYAMNVTGLNVRRLTDNAANDHFPVWSPNGSQLVFMSDRDGNDEVYVMNGDGSGQLRLTDHPAFDGYASWSPDGTELVFVSERDGNAEIYVMNTDGTNVRRLTEDASSDTLPAWSPSGLDIMFVSDRSGSDELYLMAADGSNVRRASNLFGANGWHPTWRPNAHDVAFLVRRDDLMGDIYLMDVTTNQATQLSDLTEISSHMDWSMDGEWLAFVSLRDGNSEIYVMDANGQNPMRLTDEIAEDYEPDWRTVVTPAECVVRAETATVVVRVGPGTQRGSYTFMPVEDEVLVVGQFPDETGEVWWQLDKTQFDHSENVNTLWVASAAVVAAPGCINVPLVEASPVVSVSVPTSNGSWGGCGSCSTCGYNSSECVLSPDGQCLWDPSTCAYLPPSEGGQSEPGCLSVSVSLARPGGSAGVSTGRNCGQNFAPGTVITLTATAFSGYYFSGWAGTCPNLSGYNVVTFTLTASCSAVAYFSEY